MALHRVAAASSCRIKLGFLGAVSNHQIHLLFPPQLSRQFRRPREESLYNPTKDELQKRKFNNYFAKFSREGPFCGNIVDHEDMMDPELIEPAVFALKTYNQRKNAHLQFVRVVRACSGASCGSMYYITAEALDCGEKKTYRAQVLEDASKGCKLELLEFKFEPSNQGNKQVLARDLIATLKKTPCESIVAVDKKVGVEKKGGGETDEFFGYEKHRLYANEVLDVVSQMPDLSEREYFKACLWLVENERHFHMFKLIADDMKRDYLLSAMPRDY